jgi:hypothetical protein
MVILLTAVWSELALNTSEAGKELSQWQNQLFPLLHNLAALVDGNVATGVLMISTADNDNNLPSSCDIGNDMALDSQLEHAELENFEELVDPFVAALQISLIPSSNIFKAQTRISYFPRCFSW